MMDRSSRGHYGDYSVSPSYLSSIRYCNTDLASVFKTYMVEERLKIVNFEQTILSL